MRNLSSVKLVIGNVSSAERLSSCGSVLFQCVLAAVVSYEVLIQWV